MLTAGSEAEVEDEEAFWAGRMQLWSNLETLNDPDLAGGEKSSLVGGRPTPLKNDGVRQLGCYSIPN